MEKGIEVSRKSGAENQALVSEKEREIRELKSELNEKISEKQALEKRIGLISSSKKTETEQEDEFKTRMRAKKLLTNIEQSKKGNIKEILRDLIKREDKAEAQYGLDSPQYKLAKIAYDTYRSNNIIKGPYLKNKEFIDAENELLQERMKK